MHEGRKGIKNKRRYESMEEKVYKTMGGTGALNIVLGVVMMVIGLAAGVLLIISGSMLVNRTTKLTF